MTIDFRTKGRYLATPPNVMKFKDLNLLSIGNTIHLTGAVYTGEGKTILVFFPGEQVEGDLTHLEMDHVEWEEFLRQTDQLNIEALTKDANGTITKAIVRKGTRQIDQVISWKVFKRDNYKCRYCGNDNIPLTVDHLVLWEDGGPSTEANLLSACRKCNKTRGNTEYADWLRHPFYQRVSKNLTKEVKTANEMLVGTLDKIPRCVQVRSR